VQDVSLGQNIYRITLANVDPIIDSYPVAVTASLKGRLGRVVKRLRFLVSQELFSEPCIFFPQPGTFAWAFSNSRRRSVSWSTYFLTLFGGCAILVRRIRKTPMNSIHTADRLISLIAHRLKRPLRSPPLNGGRSFVIILW
jgi:hypothetical protein